LIDEAHVLGSPIRRKLDPRQYVVSGAAIAGRL
jgi:hypothetical protein